MRPDQTEELVFFLAIVSYADEDDFDQIKAVFKNPLLLNSERIKEGIHNWFTPNFDLANLPSTATGAYWLGFNGSVSLQEKNGCPLTLKNFLATKGSHANGSDLWPITLQNSQYQYLKIIILEETGHRQLRRVLRMLGSSNVGDVILGVAQGDIISVASTVASGAIENEINIQLKKAALVDLEYYYESEKGAKKIPLHHVRKWAGKPDRPSLEIHLEFSHRGFSNPLIGLDACVNIQDGTGAGH